MAIITNYIKKRDLLHSDKSSKETLAKMGREFLAAGRVSDALDFFEKAQDLSALNEIKQLALKNGDTFLLARLDRFDRNMISSADWESAVAAAKSAGRPSAEGFVARKFPPAAAVAPVLPGSTPLAEN